MVVCTQPLSKVLKSQTDGLHLRQTATSSPVHTRVKIEQGPGMSKHPVFRNSEL